MITMESVEMEKTDREIFIELRVIFLSLGVNLRSRGFSYLLTACTEAIKNPSVLDVGVTKSLYPAIAKAYNTNWSVVERAMRTAISTIDTRSEEAIKIFGQGAVINNSFFIRAVSDYIRLGLV